ATDYVYAFESFVLKHINAALRGKKLPRWRLGSYRVEMAGCQFCGVDHRIGATSDRPVSASKIALKSSQTFSPKRRGIEPQHCAF
ncbi:hypothetical protein, partial [Aeromonas bivalvium]